MNTVGIGDIGEVMAISDFTKAGFVVSTPPKNGQKVGVKMKDDFEFSTQVEKL